MKESPADKLRRKFLLLLDGSDRIEVTDWEAQYIADHLDHPRGFTDRQRDAIDELEREYGDRL